MSGQPKQLVETAVFQGRAGVLVADVAEFASSLSSVSPSLLVDGLGKVLSEQQSVIVRHGGVIEQFVGCAVLAYWPPADPAVIATQMLASSMELIALNLKTAEFTCRLKVSFSVNECAGAFFGPASGRRFQVIGRARDLAEETMNRSLGTQAGLAIDRDTHALLPALDRAKFSENAGGDFVFLQTT